MKCKRLDIECCCRSSDTQECEFGGYCNWQEVVVPASASANSRYATALEVVNEYVVDDMADDCTIVDFIQWMRKRLNAAEKPPHSA